jgi:4-hydroxybenzoate polyprenyltransferase
LARPTIDHRPDETHGSRPLCVDLEGALLAGSLQAEHVAVELSRSLPRGLWLAVRSGFSDPLRDGAASKHIDGALLPRRPEVMALVATARAQCRRTVLVTCQPESFAASVAEAAGLFDETVTLSGSPAERAAQLVARFGSKGFSYVGGRTGEAPIWVDAASVVIVGGGELLRSARSSGAAVERHLSASAAGPSTWRRALRMHQWLKNVLVAAPALAAHALGASTLLKALLAFAAFSLCASAVYLMNDVADLASDRAHAVKRHRPLASGALPLTAVLWAVPLLLLGAGSVALQVGAPFALHLGLYFVATAAYTFALKRWAVVDVLCLAGLYVQRLLAGSSATNVPISPWFGAFAMFLFLGLALVKRAAELAQSGGSRNPRRGYRAEDLPMVTQLGTASSFAAVVVLALYLQSPTVAKLYAAPLALWALCPLALFWQARIWLLTGRGEMSDDPVLFAARDRVSYAVLLVAILIVVLAA